MVLQSDITINVSKFDPASVSEQTASLNKSIVERSATLPQWFEVGAAKFRQMQLNGETLTVPATLLPEALNINVPSRETGRDIPCRLVYPSSRKTVEERRKCKGVLLHIHGGGWVTGDHLSQDARLLFQADAGDLAVLSVGYRLAPEHPYPQGPDDCVDVAEYLVKNARDEYGGPLRFIGGESAGGHLSLIVAMHLLKSQPDFKLSGLILNYGCFDMTRLPSFQNCRKNLILSRESMEQFIEQFLPGTTFEERKSPLISPYYEDFESFRDRLPSAFFTCGTDDLLLDDSISMATKWMVSGGESIIKIYPGACHSFLGMAPDKLAEAGKALEDTKSYIEQRLALE